MAVIEDSLKQELVRELLEAGRTGTQIPLITKRFPELCVEDAYAIQREWRMQSEAANRKLVGRKIGLTSRAMQQATGITEPDYGVIFQDMVRESGVVLPWEDYARPRVEVELVFALEKDLEGPDCTLLDVLAATEYVLPAIEVLDARIEFQGRTIVDTISDNAAIGVMLTGGTPTRPVDIDLRWASAILYRNEAIEETGVAAGVLGHPGLGVSWLANKLAQHGDSLRAGDLILSGSFTRPVSVQRGDTVLADFGALGTVTCRFA